MKFVVSFFVIFSFFIQSCQVEPQDPKLIFKNAQSFPATLTALANPNPNNQPALLSHLLQKKPEGRIGVAVIDNGVDYMHRDLISQIRFTINGGKVQGAGFDAMGADFAAHSNIVNPILFGLMAEKVEFGQLVNVQGDPLTWMNQVQNDFTQVLYANLKADPSLVGTLAANKVNEKTFSIFVLGVPSLLKKWQTYGSKEFKRFKADGKLVNFKEGLDPLYREFGKQTVDAFLSDAWVISRDNGFARELVQGLFYHYADAEKLMGHIAIAFNAINARHQVIKRLENFNVFGNFINTGWGTLAPEERAGDLTRSWLYARNLTGGSPILEMVDSICTNFPRAVTEQLRNPQLTPDQRWSTFRSATLRMLLTAGEIAKRRLQIEPMTEQEKLDMQKELSTLGHYQTMLDEIFTQRPYLRAYLTCQKDLLMHAAHDQGLSNFVRARRHPYISDYSETESHGTHVSGIIARQSKAIEIVPVRVVTSSNPPLPLQVQKLRASFERGFAAWLSNPQVAAGLGTSKIAAGIFGRALTAQDIATGMKKFLDTEMFANYLDFTFFDQIKLAIQYVGSQKIKVANMSLGTNFNKAVISPDKKDFEALVKSFYNFVMYEYFKFDVAIAIQQYARNTLFVVAAGNDGAWLDGNSKSGLPCDLSSPVLVNVPNLPNNQIKNILCVGSMDDQKLLSSFTNIPLTAVPFVLSYGEAILSPIKTTDCEGATAQYLNQMGSKLGGVPYWVGFDQTNSKYDDILKTSGYWVVDPFNPDLDTLRGTVMSQTFDNSMALGTIANAMTQHRCMKADRNNMGRMSGTSMATPAVAGFVAKALVKKLNGTPATRGMTDAQIYEDPAYAPEKIIAEILGASPAFGGTSLIKDVKMIPEIMKWRPSQQRVNQMVGVRVTDLLRAN